MLEWKTNWQSSDNYARNGAADAARLIHNYEYLRNLLNSEYGYAIAFVLPELEGYDLYPFDDVLNAIEGALAALRAWAVDWLPAPGPWQPAGAAPSYQDINRWEKNGALIEQAAQLAAQRRIYSNEVYSGEV